MSKKEINETAINRLAELLNEHKLTEIEYEDEDFSIKVKREPAPVAAVAPAPVYAAAPSPASVSTSESADQKPAGYPVTSPMVGIIYCRPEPGAPEFCKPGDEVKEGDTLFLIEAMKTFNPVRASRGGKVLAVMVEEGAPVEYGEVLLTLG